MFGDDRTTNLTTFNKLMEEGRFIEATELLDSLERTDGREFTSPLRERVEKARGIPSSKQEPEPDHEGPDVGMFGADSPTPADHLGPLEQAFKPWVEKGEVRLSPLRQQHENFGPETSPGAEASSARDLGMYNEDETAPADHLGFMLSKDSASDEKGARTLSSDDLRAALPLTPDETATFSANEFLRQFQNAPDSPILQTTPPSQRGWTRWLPWNWLS